jgi:hypothetical protein
MLQALPNSFTVTRLHYLCALLSVAFLFSIALGPAPAQAQEETRQATPTSQRPSESPSYYLRHPEETIPRSVRHRMPAPLLERIRQERSRRARTDQRRREAGKPRLLKDQRLLPSNLQSKSQKSAANLVMRAGDVLTEASTGSASIADVDGDQNKDLLVTGSGSPWTTLYLGDGQGGFTEGGAGLTGVEFSSTSIGDVDRDGNPDLLITGRDENFNLTATLYLGDGQGSFTEANAGLTGTYEGSTSIADVDGDGNQDLLITGFGENGRSATLYLGDKQGSFSAADAGLAGVSGSSTSIADVNGDGNQDLLITGSSNSGPLATLYLGDGQGGFTEAGASLAGVLDSSTSIGDVNGDGNQDLLITGSDPFDRTATLYLGDGRGGFEEAGAGLTGVSSGDTLVEDVDGDGDLDLYVSGSDALFAEGSARIYINRQNQPASNRPPTFARAFSYDRPLAPGVTLRGNVEAGDLDGDPLSITSSASNVSVSDRGNGTAKVAFTPTRNQGGDVVQFSIEASDPSGAIGSSPVSVEVSPHVATFSAGLIGTGSSSTSIADVNGDDHKDLLITGNDSNRNPTATLYLGDGQGGFEEAGARLTGVKRSSTSVADVDGDGNQDLLITGSSSSGSTATLYLGDGQGGFEEAGADLTGVERSSTSIGDVDGDGNQDLLITGNDENFDPTATLYLGKGQGGFDEAGAGLTGVLRSSTSIADVDGDGNLDLLITGRDENRNPTATLYLGDGQGGFEEAGAGLAGTRQGSTSIGDVDGDGNQDLLITGSSSSGSTATLYLGDGQGGFEVAGAGLTGVAFGSSTSIADVDGDGNQDLLITGLAGFDFDPTATLYLGNGQGGFEEAGVGLAGTREGSTSIGDVDGDGNQDLLITGVLPGIFRSSQSRSATLYENLFDNPLPVELVGFKATVSGGKVRLSWTTVSETGNAGFRVQRRLGSGNGGGAWEQIGQVEGAGTTTEAKSYRFADTDIPYRADRLEYRLKQVDTDGSSALSDPVTVERSVDEMELLGTYPNPARSQATVRYALPEKQEVTLRLYDMLGRQVRTVLNGTREGRYKQRVDMSGLPSGTYFLRLRSDGKTRTQKLTVVR